MSQFKPGDPKPPRSGRKRGTPNKGTSDLQCALEGHGLDIVGQLATLLPKLAEDKRADILVDLMGYLYPKRKAVEQRIELDQVQAEKVETPEQVFARKQRVSEMVNKLKQLDGCECSIRDSIGSENSKG